MQQQAAQAQQQSQLMMALLMQHMQPPQQQQPHHQAPPPPPPPPQQQALPLVVIHPWTSLHPSHLPDTPAGTHLVLASAQPWPGYWSVVYHSDAGPTSRLIGRQFAELGASCLLRPGAPLLLSLTHCIFALAAAPPPPPPPPPLMPPPPPAGVA